jgi:formylglycine-generating enzyme required for sulfatase activity
MFRQSATVALVALTALGSLASATAQEVKKVDDKRQITNSIGMKLTLIPAGEFMMGSGESAEDTAAFFEETYNSGLTADTFKHEHPQHRVRITRPFYLGTFEVTRGQFRRFVEDTAYKTDAEKGKEPGVLVDYRAQERSFDKNYSWRNIGFQQTDEHPVVAVSWNDAMAFCQWLSRKEGETYRLPTEAEWEYACRAGTTTRYYSGDDPETLATVANVADAALKAKFPKFEFSMKASDGYVFTAPVGQFKPNAFGLYDMHGNAFEWCSDWFGKDYFGKSPTDDPTGPGTGEHRVMRGGAWNWTPIFTRSADRAGYWPNGRTDNIGFRVARTSYPPEERAGLSGKPTTRMRPLGRHLLVDEHGIIWDDGRPVGIWGVNGSPMANAPGGFGGRDGNRQLLAPPAR